LRNSDNSMYRAIITILFAIIFIGTALSGCSQPMLPVTHPSPFLPLSPSMDNITGHVYLDGQAVSGAYVDAVSWDGTHDVNTTTCDDGSYTLNVRIETKYNLTASWRGLTHTVWPVYLPDDTNIYDINLTSTPRSTIEGSGITIGPGGNPELFKIYDHKPARGFRMGVIPVGGNTSITTVTDNTGNYILVVEPNVLYEIRGGPAGMSPPSYIIPVANFRYRMMAIL